MLSPQSLQFGMSLLMMACVPFSSPGQQRLKTKEVSDCSVLRNYLTRSSLLMRHPDREMVYCKRACRKVVLYDVCLQSPLTHLLYVGHLLPPIVPHSWVIAHREQECQGVSFLRWRMFNWDWSLKLMHPWPALQDKDPCLWCLPSQSATGPGEPCQGPTYLWHPNLPALKRASWSSINLNSLQAISAPSHQLPTAISVFLLLIKDCSYLSHVSLFPHPQMEG